MFTKEDRHKFLPFSPPGGWALQDHNDVPAVHFRERSSANLTVSDSLCPGGRRFGPGLAVTVPTMALQAQAPQGDTLLQAQSRWVPIVTDRLILRGYWRALARQCSC